MLKKFTNVIRQSTTKLVDHLVHTKLVTVPTTAFKRFGQRHVELMTTGAAYRTQIAAAAAALVALSDLPTPWATLILSLVAIYVATFTPNGSGWYARSLSSPYDLDDERW